MSAMTSRKGIKKYGILILLLFLLSHLTACESKTAVTENTPDISKNETENTPVEIIQTDEPVHNQIDENLNAMKDAYTAILKGIYEDHTFPDGQACDWIADSDLSQNQFAIYDIDQDGKDELIIAYTNAYMAGMVELIYGFDSESKITSEAFREFPALTYYENGIIKAEWSHNQGLAGDFWPYNLYQYDSETDGYVNVGMVDAWDRSLSETNYNGDSFPTASDVDEDGIVYYIMRDGTYELDHPVDLAEYEQWYNGYIGDSEVTQVPFASMTREHIDEITK